MIRTRSKLVLLALAGAFAFIVGASPSLIARAPAKALDSLQDPPPPAQDPEANPGRGGRGGQAAAPRPYAQVITSAAKTDDGIFKVHRVADTLYYEIPKAELGKDFLWNTQIKKTTLGAGLGGQIVSSRVVRWVQKGDRVLLQSIDYSVVADPKDPVAMAVEDSNYPSIIRTLPVAAYAPSGDPVIDVTAFFMTDIPEFSARGAVGGRGLATDRSFLERAVSFPTNINVEATLTYTGGAADPAAGGGGGRGGAGRGMRGSSGTVVVHHSLMKLPERPLMPRYYDQRVGFFTQQLVDFGTAEHRSVQKQFIKRFRLEKKDANAAVSDPVQPIVFYIDPATPKQWVASVRKGIESWQPAFEMAGFRNAIVARDAPAGDAEWSAEDARYSVVRWLPSPEEAAGEPPAEDPRSGEILKAEIPAYPDMANFGTTWYVVQAGPADKRVQKLPLPDEIMGELIRYTVAHQIGHALGLQHNMKASSSYTIAQIRDPKWVKDMGFTPSIMDNTRFHYVAQPEDGIDPIDLIPKVGPYDKWAVRWGYAPVPGAATPDAEESQLDRWAREQDDKPYLRFSTDGAAGTDPGDGPEAVGNADAVMATTLGLKNLVRVSDMLLAFTGTKTGDPWDDLETLYGRMATQWSTEMSHVVRVVGGIESQQTHIGQAGLRFRTVPRLRQQQALQFLLNNAFTTPAFMIKPEILRRIQPSGIVQRIRTAQTTLLASLLENSRLDRMAEQFTIDGAVAYPPLQFLTDLRAGLWSELRTPGPRPSISTAATCSARTWISWMPALYGTPASSDETRSLVKGELRALDRQLQTAAAAPGLDETTRRHYLDAREAIATTLDPRVPRPAPAAGAAPAGRGRGGIALLAPGRVTGQVPPAQDPPDPAAGRGGRGGQGGQGGTAPRPYAQVITSAAKTDAGIFKVHRIGATRCTTRSRRVNSARTSSGTRSSRRPRSAPATAVRPSAAVWCAG